MELLCALLTAVLLWLFIYHCFYGCRDRARKKAGDLLLRLSKPHSGLSRIWIAASVSGLSCIVIFWVCLFMSRNRLMIDSWFAFKCFNVVMSWIYILHSGTRSLELREHGVLAMSGRPIVFAPWYYIRYCKWKPDLRKLFIQYSQHNMEYPIRPNQADAANAILTQHVEVRRADGTTIADGSRRQISTDAVEATELPEPEIRRLQFTLRTLLLLMLVLSSAFSWLGVRMRSWERQRTAIAKFEKMQPRVSYLSNEVFGLDFSACKVKPTDKDLVHLSKLPRLEFLDLVGAPITDAGLKYLEGLTSLRLVVVRQTQVTDEGVQELERALPDATIWH